MLDDQEGREIYFMLDALLQMLRCGDPTAVQLAAQTLDTLRHHAAPAWARRMDNLQFPTQAGLSRHTLIADMDNARIEEQPRPELR
jgi:hypothetical protein